MTELDERITDLGPDNRPTAYIGTYDPATRTRPGRPNAAKDGKTDRPQVRDGAFNRLTEIAVDADGSIYVTEWLIGGRLDKVIPR